MSALPVGFAIGPRLLRGIVPTVEAPTVEDELRLVCTNDPEGFGATREEAMKELVTFGESAVVALVGVKAREDEFDTVGAFAGRTVCATNWRTRAVVLAAARTAGVGAVRVGNSFVFCFLDGL